VVAAEFSEKTVFNHSPTRRPSRSLDGRRGSCGSSRTSRAPTHASVLDIFRALTASVIDDLVASGDEDFLAVAKVIRHTPMLQERLTVGWQSGTAAIIAAIAETSGAAEDDLVPGISLARCDGRHHAAG
jgi:hypothetical protein